MELQPKFEEAENSVNMSFSVLWISRERTEH